MHIAFVSPAWPLGSYPNGIVTYVHWMREALLQQGHRVSVFTGMLDEVNNHDADIHLVRPPRLARWRSWLDRKVGRGEPPEFAWGLSIGRAIGCIHRRDPIDIVEVEESFGWATDIEAQSRVPVAIKLHGPAFLSLVGEELNTALAASKIQREGEAMARAGRVLAPSRRVLDQTIALYGLQPRICEQVVNPIRLADQTPLWRLDGCDTNTILFVGRFDARKGGDTALLAFRKLLDVRPHAKLVFVGPDVGVCATDGSRMHFAQFVASVFPLELRGAIRFLGRLKPEDIPVLRAGAMVTLAASRWENQSYATLEAMLQGCPVVCVESGGQGEIVEHEVSGLLARPEDPEHLCGLLARVIADPELARRLGGNARRYALEHHSPPTVAARSIELYRRMIGVPP